MLQLSPIKVSVFMSLFLCAGVAVFVAIHFMRLDNALDLNDQMVISSLNIRVSKVVADHDDLLTH